jgi:hypothetical protein
MAREVLLSLAAGLLLVAAVSTTRSSHDQSRSLESGLSPRAPGDLGESSDELEARVATAYGRLPLHFEANQGQTDPRVKFLARGIGHAVFLTDSEAVLVLAKPDHTQQPTQEPAAPGTGVVLRMTFVGANPRPRIGGLDELSGKANYFVGNDPARWRTNVPLYAKVRYNDLYPGSALSYSGNQGSLQSDFVLAPGADPNRIVLRWRGADSLSVDAQGSLVLHTAIGTVQQSKPVIYQALNGLRHAIAGHYVVKGAQEVGFAIGAYDSSRSLFITSGVPLSVQVTR